MNNENNAEHYKACEQLVKQHDRNMLLEMLYTMFTCDEGNKTDNMRKAILIRLDELSGTTWMIDKR